MEYGLTYLLKSIAFCETASADYTMSFALNLAFLHMIQDLWPGNFSQLPPVVTQEELAFPLGLTSNADFHGQDPNGTYPVILMHEPVFGGLVLHLRAWGATPSERKSLFFVAPGRPTPLDIIKRVFSVSFGPAYILFFYQNYCLCFNIMQGKLKTLVATMALYKVPGADAFNGTLPLSASIIPNEGYAKYVCLDP